jgi:hypothetical protein
VAIVLRNPLNPVVPAVNPIPRGEGASHQKAKKRIYDLVNKTGPKTIGMEYMYPNPFSPEFPWRFDVYAELKDGRRIAIEIDGKIGHTSKRSAQKRQAKKEYLQAVGIELYSFPTKWVAGRRMLPDSLFIEEIHLS